MSEHTYEVESGEAPTGSNADEWALFLSEWRTAYCAVQIAEAIEAAEQRGYARGIEAAAKVADKMDGFWFQGTYKASYNKKRYSADQVEQMARKPLCILSEDIGEAIRALAEQEGE